MTVIAIAFALASVDAPTAVVLLDDARCVFPTFGAYNQHAAEHGGRYYVSYFDDGFVRIATSTDQGRTWTDCLPPRGRKGDQPPAIAVDEDGRLHAVWSDEQHGRYLRFTDGEVDRDLTLGACNTKFALAYDAAGDVLYWSRRENSTLHLVTLDTSGEIRSDVPIVRPVGEWGAPREYWDAHYHALHVDATGTLHLIYTAYRWPDATKPGTYTQVRVLYMSTRDAGRTWSRADGEPVPVPHDVSSFAPTSISEESQAWGASVSVDERCIHVVYQSGALHHVRLDRKTGALLSRRAIDGFSMHAVLVSDRTGGRTFLLGERENVPTLLLSRDDGWVDFATVNRPPVHGGYFAASACPFVTSDGAVIGLTSDHAPIVPGETPRQSAVFLRYPVR